MSMSGGIVNSMSHEIMSTDASMFGENRGNHTNHTNHMGHGEQNNNNNSNRVICNDDYITAEGPANYNNNNTGNMVENRAKQGESFNYLRKSMNDGKIGEEIDDDLEDMYDTNVNNYGMQQNNINNNNNMAVFMAAAGINNNETPGNPHQTPNETPDETPQTPFTPPTPMNENNNSNNNMLPKQQQQVQQQQIQQQQQQQQKQEVRLYANENQNQMQNNNENVVNVNINANNNNNNESSDDSDNDDGVVISQEIGGGMTNMGQTKQGINIVTKGGMKPGLPQFKQNKGYDSSSSSSTD